MNEPEREPLSWFGLVILAALVLALMILTPAATRLLVNVGWNEYVANIFVVGVGMALLAAALTAIVRVQRKRPLSAARLKGVVFGMVTMTVIYAVHLVLQFLIESLGWPAEVQYHGSWLAAIVIVGWPADIIRKRMGIEFPRRNPAPPNST